MCGTALTKRCGTCGRANPPESQFCGHCGSPLDDEEAAVVARRVEERRRATVLFADLSGFTSVSETLDPEEVTALVDRCMQPLGETIERYGGVISNVAGDGLLAVFGVPRAHEDDPERAVRAGLEMQRCVREQVTDFGGLELRVGVNTGEMMFARVGPRSRREPTVYGDAVNTASRLETAAPVGGVLVGEETYSATRESFVYEQVPALRVKGKAAPVAAWVAVEPRGAPAKRAVSVVPMVGRDLELDLLWRMWERTSMRGRPHLTTVHGPAGIGKTRLVDELLRRIVARDAATVVHSGRCLPYGQGITYWPLREILWAAAGIPLDDTAAAAAERLRRLVARLATGGQLDAAEAERTTFALATSSGVALPGNPLERMSPESVAEEVGLAWPRFLSALAADAPATVVVEDLHWAEPPLLEMIERILARSSGRLFLLTTARPEFAEMRPRWGSMPGISQIALEPLTAVESRELLSDLLPNARPDLHETVIAAAEGNPLFTEEIVRHLGDSDAASTLPIPSTVWALLAGRIDALPDAEKAVLQDAAVVGRAFWATALDAMRPGRAVDDSLRALEEKGLIVTRPTSSMLGQTELWFRHALIRDVAYGSIPRRRRAAAHAEVAAWLDQLAGDRREEFIDLLAHHYESAATPERDEIRGKAVQALLQAGGAARRGYAIDQALGFADRALALASTDGERLAGLELRARSLHAAIHADEALASYSEALEIASELGDRDGVGRLRAYATLLCARYSGALSGETWKTTAAAMVTEGLAEFGEDPETFEVGALLVGRSRMPRWSGSAPDREQARRDAERAIEVAEAIDSPYLLAYAVEALSQPTVQEGFCEAAAIGERMIQVGEILADRIEANETLVLAAVALVRAGRAGAAEEAADAAARHAQQLSPHRRIHAACGQTTALLASGKLAKLAEATADVPELIREDGGRVCPFGAMALAGHAVSLYEAQNGEAAAVAVELLDSASQGAEGPTMLYRAAEIVRPLTDLESTRSRLERIAGSPDVVPRIYELRAALQLCALADDRDRLHELIAEARALAGPACAPSLGWIAEWAEAVELARSSAAAASFSRASRATGELEANAERYTAGRLMTDLLPLLQGQLPASTAAGVADRLDAMGASASAAEARAIGN
jgi:class 3 adenylate cyclase/tetratricopeptide (TPR) repeat protein